MQVLQYKYQVEKEYQSRFLFIRFIAFSNNYFLLSSLLTEIAKLKFISIKRRTSFLVIYKYLNFFKDISQTQTADSAVSLRYTGPIDRLRTLTLNCRSLYLKTNVIVAVRNAECFLTYLKKISLKSGFRKNYTY